MSMQNSTEIVLVTGANGFVGLNLVRYLALGGARVVAATRRAPDADCVSELDDRVEWVICDVTDRDTLADLMHSRKVTRVIHAAAVTPTLDMEQENPTRIVDVNLGGTINALEASLQGRVKRFVFVSSGVMYRGLPFSHGLAREDDAQAPDNLYGICKEACERLCQRYHALCGLSTVSARLGTAYGPWERAGPSRTRLSAIARLCMLGLKRREQPLRVHGIHVRREFIHVEDACAAMAGLAFHPAPRWAVYNISSDTGYTLEDVLSAMRSCLPGLHWQHVDNPEMADVSFSPDDMRIPLDLSRIQADLPHCRFRDLQMGIADYIAWCQ